MACIPYRPHRFYGKTQERIERANAILDEYPEGFALTLRQLFYQFVSRSFLPNTVGSYTNLRTCIRNARMAGVLDWERIVDRTRPVLKLSHWDSPAEGVRAMAQQFRLDKWEGEECRPEIWIEKDALLGVVEPIREEYDAPLFSCRGYPSTTALWNAVQRMEAWESEDQNTIVFHFGDHDPSGVDITRDIRDRLAEFGVRTEVVRVALTSEQITNYKLPPNPAKRSDTRHDAYVAEFGKECVELDALPPLVLEALVRDSIRPLIDQDAWTATLEQQQEGRNRLEELAQQLEEQEQEDTADLQ